ncbi:hypothetical protein D3C81_1433370 [compost metagenome]
MIEIQLMNRLEQLSSHIRVLLERLLCFQNFLTDAGHFTIQDRRGLRRCLQAHPHFIRQAFTVFIVQGMFNRCPEIHRQGADLNFGKYNLLSQSGLHRIFNNHMEAAVAAFLIICDVIFFIQHFKVFTGTDIFRHSADIFNELAHNPYAGDIFNARFQILHFHTKALSLLQYAGQPFYTSGYELNRRVFFSFLKLRAHCFEFNLEFFHSLFIWKQKSSPVPAVHRLRPPVHSSFSDDQRPPLPGYERIRPAAGAALVRHAAGG